ncbi:MAG TPA: phosphoenolpyruvate synthase [Candidatus Paceibacterota bacterium]
MSDRASALILQFRELTIDDIPLVGGKNAALGEMVSNFAPLGIAVPDGFAITATAYNHFLDSTALRPAIERLLNGLNTRKVRDLARRGAAIRHLISSANLPDDLRSAITAAYHELGGGAPEGSDVAVRSSATAEDLPDASFAGQQETYLNIRGLPALEQAVKDCFASLFTNRAISYRVDKGFPPFTISLSVGVQRMVRSDKGVSGVAFSLDTETGFPEVVVINSSYGLGEMVVQGKVTPDEFTVFKPTLALGFQAIIARNLGTKETKMIYGHGQKSTEVVAVSARDRVASSLTDDEIIRLASWVVKIEKYFSERRGRYQPMDTEWAKDGLSGELFIVQARPETIHALAEKHSYQEYRLKAPPPVALVTGAAVGSKIGAGRVRVIKSAAKIAEFKEGEVLVTKITDPDWEPIMKIASAIITDQGGRTSHAAIVSRELGITCIVGTGDATKVLKTGMAVTVDCSAGRTGRIYPGILDFEKIEHRLDQVPETRTKVMVNIGSPDEAFSQYRLPVAGIGLGRIEFIITEHIRIHPQALIDFDTRPAVTRKDVARRKLYAQIKALTPGYKDKRTFYVDELAEGVAKIAAIVYPQPAIIRFSDFKTNEYRTLIGGEQYEPVEENPMIGWRGASRYYHDNFRAAFALECAAIKKARTAMGLTNIIPMIPFCRTPEEGRKVLDLMVTFGLDRVADSSLKIYMMCEIPANIILADDFLNLFDGFSIGSNDLAQLTLGLDRDSGIVNKIADENNTAVKRLIEMAIEKAKAHNKYIGICGQAPSDFPDFAAFLVAKGIDSISLNPDTVIATTLAIAEQEKKI